jgi:hypothetical protein
MSTPKSENIKKTSRERERGNALVHPQNVIQYTNPQERLLHKIHTQMNTDRQHSIHHHQRDKLWMRVCARIDLVLMMVFLVANVVITMTLMPYEE